VRLRLVKVHRRRVLVDFVKEELVVRLLRSQDIKTNTSRLLARLHGVGLDEGEELVHPIGLNFGLNNDGERFGR